MKACIVCTCVYVWRYVHVFMFECFYVCVCVCFFTALSFWYPAKLSMLSLVYLFFFVRFQLLFIIQKRAVNGADEILTYTQCTPNYTNSEKSIPRLLHLNYWLYIYIYIYIYSNICMHLCTFFIFSFYTLFVFIQG